MLDIASRDIVSRIQHPSDRRYLDRGYASLNKAVSGRHWPHRKQEGVHALMLDMPRKNPMDALKEA
jgi:hypothetical protein